MEKQRKEDLRIVAVRRDQPDVRKLARVLLALVLEQADVPVSEPVVESRTPDLGTWSAWSGGVGSAACVGWSAIIVDVRFCGVGWCWTGAGASGSAVAASPVGVGSGL